MAYGKLAECERTRGKRSTKNTGQRSDRNYASMCSTLYELHELPHHCLCAKWTIRVIAGQSVCIFVSLFAGEASQTTNRSQNDVENSIRSRIITACTSMLQTIQRPAEMSLYEFWRSEQTPKVRWTHGAHAVCATDVCAAVFGFVCALFRCHFWALRFVWMFFC